MFTMIRFCSVCFELDEKQLKVKYDHTTLRHKFHEKGFLYGISDLINLLEANHDKENISKNSRSIENTRAVERMDRIIVPLNIHDRNITLKKLKDSIKKCLEHVLIKIHNDIYERMTGLLQGDLFNYIFI